MSIACTVSEISWDRVHLGLTIRVENHPVPEPDPTWPDELSEQDQRRLGFSLFAGIRLLPMTTDQDADGSYRVTLNITNFHDRKQVPNGTWRIVPTLDGEQVGPGAVYPLGRISELDPVSRSFLYNSNKSAYVINFDITEDDVRPELVLRAYTFGRGGGKKPGGLKKVKDKLTGHQARVKLVNRVYRTARRLQPPNGKRILFASEQRTALGGNLLQVRDQMLERGLDQEYEFSYSFRTPAIGTRLTTVRLLWLLARSDYVLIDDYFPMMPDLKLDPSTVLIQLWHAGSGFKTIGYSRFGRYGSPRLTNAHRTYTYAICGSQHLIGVYAEAFGIEESAVVPTGLPRIDKFLDPDRTARIRAEFAESYPDLVGKRLILFAPTFRGRGIKDGYYDYDELDLPTLYEGIGPDSVLLFRMHHFITEPPPIPPEFADRMRNFADYPDTNDLLHNVDVLITDYSSIIYEYSLLDRPMLFFAYDEQIYEATRGFHRDYELTAPGKVVGTSAQLVAALQHEDYDMWKIERFRRDNFDHVDTHSADRVIDWLILGTPPGTAGSEQAAATEEVVVASNEDVSDDAAVTADLDAAQENEPPDDSAPDNQDRSLVP